MQILDLLQHIEKTGPCRTPDLASKFALSERRIASLLAPFVQQKVLVACTVLSRGKQMLEYRAMGGKIGHVGNFRNFAILPRTERVRMMERSHV